MKKPFPILTVGIICLAGGLVIYLPCLLGALYLFVQQTEAMQHVAVIGGADGPTAELMIRMLFRSPLFWITLIGGLLGKTGSIAGMCMTLAGIINHFARRNA